MTIWNSFIQTIGQFDTLKIVEISVVPGEGGLCHPLTTGFLAKGVDQLFPAARRYTVSITPYVEQQVITKLTRFNKVHPRNGCLPQ